MNAGLNKNYEANKYKKFFFTYKYDLSLERLLGVVASILPSCGLP